MRINEENKSVDMERRDINYILPAYVRSYLFYAKNEMPLKIIFPMYPSVMVGSVEIPIEYVPPLDAIAIDIAKDGEVVAEVTADEEAKLDEKDEEIKRLKAKIEDMKTTKHPADEPEPPSKARAAFAEPASDEPTSKPKTPPARKPKQPPGGDIGTGVPLSDMHPRDRRDQTRVAKALTDEPEIEGAAEKEFDKTVSRDEHGKPIVEDRKES